MNHKFFIQFPLEESLVYSLNLSQKMINIVPH